MKRAQIERRQERARKLVSNLKVARIAKCEMCCTTIEYILPEFPTGWIMCGRSRWKNQYAYSADWAKDTAWWCPRCQKSSFAAGNDGISSKDWMAGQRRGG